MSGKAKTGSWRLMLVAIAAIVEITVTVTLLNYFYTQFAWIETLLRVASLLIVLLLIRFSRHLSSDLMWILLIIVSPIFGTAAYLLLGANLALGATYRSIVAETERAKPLYGERQENLAAAEAEIPDLAGQLRYLAREGFPTYRNTGFSYYGLGEEGFPHMLEDLEQAKRFVFLEYFIIEPGIMWDSMLEVLVRKADEGVDVRVLYDDIGSVGTLPASYARELEARGIKCEPFNRVNPIVNIFLNHRDHRKVLVIDGEVAYSGGINLADEYINAVIKFGHWKDNVIRVTGEAVWSYTVMFLSMWNALRHDTEDYALFRVEPLPGEPDGFVCPYAVTPLTDDKCGQDVYLNIVNQAHGCCYIVTPYLIIDTDMQNALILAAKRGVDVRIVTPGVPDKKVIWDITRSYYASLIAGGVRIFEYTPGFVHAKIFVADGQVATVGTLNLDYRSLYLHFENGTLLADSRVVEEVARDVREIIGASHEMTLEESLFGLRHEFAASVLRLLAPLL